MVSTETRLSRSSDDFTAGEARALQFALGWRSEAGFAQPKHAPKEITKMSQTDDLDQMKVGTADVPVEKVLLERWSPRSFTDKTVSDEDLKSIFTAAAWAASSYNEQPWRFLVGRKGDETWQKIFDSLMAQNQAWASRAPVLYASVAKKSFTQNQMANAVAAHDVGAASANASLQATKLGLHTHGMGGFDRDKLRAALGIPEEFDMVACWALGYRGEPEVLAEPYLKMEASPRQRKPLSEFVYGSWESSLL